MRLVQHLLEIPMNVKTLIHYGNPTMEMVTTNIVVIAIIADGKDNVQELQIIVQEVHPVIGKSIYWFKISQIDGSLGAFKIFCDFLRHIIYTLWRATF